jgi:ABC-2 type transport system ATP-binding protein
MAGWSNLLYALGVPASRNRLDPHIGSAYQEGLTTGRLSDENVRWFVSRGPGDLVKRIRIPTFLTQGTVDTLFTLNEATTNYEILRRNGVPAKMMWTRTRNAANPDGYGARVLAGRGARQ